MKAITAKQKWIYSSSATALFSMFLPWFVWGVRSDNGWETDYYFVLVGWFIPLISAYNNFNWKALNIISLLIGSLAFVVFFVENASITLPGDTYSSHVGAGAFVYLLAWVAAGYAEFMVPTGTYDANDIAEDVISDSTNEELFLKVTRDFENNKIDEALWIKSLTICDGDKEKAKFKYIKDKVRKLEQEAINDKQVRKTTIVNARDEDKNKLEDESFRAVLRIANFVMGGLGGFCVWKYLLSEVGEGEVYGWLGVLLVVGTLALAWYREEFKKIP